MGERCVIRPAPLASSKAVLPWTDAGAGLGPCNFNMGGASYQISGSGCSDKNATKSRNSRIIVQGWAKVRFPGSVNMW